MWPFFLARKQLFPPRRFPVFAFISILGVACGVTALLVVQTVMNSFGEEHRIRIREADGEVTLHTSNKFIPDVSKVEVGIAALPGVKAVSPYINNVLVVIGESEDDIRFFGTRGIDIDKEPTVTPLAKYIEYGSLNDLDDDRIIIGKRLAIRLGVRIGSRITVQSPYEIAHSIKGEKIKLPRELEICGFFSTGFADADENTSFVTMRTARDLFGMPPDSASAIHLTLRDPAQAESFAEELNRRLPLNMFAEPWTEARRAFLDAIGMEKQMLFLLMFIITLVASFSIGSTLFSHVVRRTREIGLISALGGAPSKILQVFMTQGFLIGILGYGIGLGLTFLILHFRQQIVTLMGAEATLLKQYRFETVPLHYDSNDFIKAAVLTIVLMTLASLIPSIWAARRKPSEAMRDVT
ncbi:MAG: ABC transporter permease [Puniceicoccales bacterium]|jgi:lipoprotein-releasing system permease protein|nr:ABC transporter permease [Puniceicoccales bacterium]